ncbi:hypothetical protein GCK32_015414 [Trichostrongylus colubriformis]|uniref:Uncharacterized protein n=1 Tax=Trichostrongylus colubriformis TaxID=6319 RepID=A0AAN8IA48_TRICO
MELLSSPSYHYISPITRSRSDVRTPAMRRSNSFSGSGSALAYSSSASRFTRPPSYGYGGGYMARSLSRCGILTLSLHTLKVLPFEISARKATWASRRDKELNLSASLSRGNYTYTNRYNRFASRLY